MDFDTSMEDEYDILGLDSQSLQADQVIWHSTQTTHTYLDTLIKDSVVPIRRSPRLSNHPPTYSESSFASPSVSTKLSKVASSSGSSSTSSVSKSSSRSKPRSKPTSRARLRRSEPPPVAADLSFHILSSIPFVSAQINAGLDQAKNKKQRGMSVGVQDHARTALGVMQTTSAFPPTRVNGKGKEKERDIGNISAHRSLSDLTLKPHFLRRSNSHLSMTDEEVATDNDAMDGGMDVDRSFNAMEVDQPSFSKTTHRMSMPPPPALVQLDISRQQLQPDPSHPSSFSCIDNNHVLECAQSVYQPPPPPPESIPARSSSPRQKSPPLKPAPRMPILVDTPQFPSMSQHSSRPPPLGMRRTHTFPSSTPSTSTSNTGLPTRQRGFKPPLMTQVEKQRKEAKRLKEIQQALQSDGGDEAKVTEELMVAVKMEKVKEEPGYPKDAPLPSGSPPPLRREQSTRIAEASASGNGSNIPGGHWSTNRGSVTRSGYKHCSSNTTYTSIPSTHAPSGSQSSGTSHDHHSIVATSVLNTSTSESHCQPPQGKSVSRPNGRGMSEPQATVDIDRDQNREVHELLVPNDGDPDSSFGEVDFSFDEDLFQQVVSKYD